MTLGFMLMELVVLLQNQAAPQGRELRLLGIAPLPLPMDNK